MLFKIFKADPKVEDDKISFVLFVNNNENIFIFDSEIIYDIHIDNRKYNIEIKNGMFMQYITECSYSAFQTKLSKQSLEKIELSIKEFFKSCNIEPINGYFTFDIEELNKIL